MRPGPAVSRPRCCPSWSRCRAPKTPMSWPPAPTLPMPIREQVLGPEHPDTLITRGSLARCTGEAGDAAGARD
jgi:hypothetical protein